MPSLENCIKYIDIYTNLIIELDTKLSYTHCDSLIVTRDQYYKIKICYILSAAPKLTKQQLYKYIISVLPAYYNSYKDYTTLYTNYNLDYMTLNKQNKHQLITFINGFINAL
jgi:hypothetical protein